ncbi:hypothetical protein GCM10027159_21120 [Lysobacter terrae]
MLRLNRNRPCPDERAGSLQTPRYNSRTSSAVRDSLRKHSPCPLMTTTGAQRKPGVQVRLVAESPKASKRPHLNPGFKVVSQASHTGGGLFLFPQCSASALHLSCFPAQLHKRAQIQPRSVALDSRSLHGRRMAAINA